MRIRACEFRRFAASDPLDGPFLVGRFRICATRKVDGTPSRVSGTEFEAVPRPVQFKFRPLEA
eukprot:3255627-Alexandrium_andersonii.AAC.1